MGCFESKAIFVEVENPKQPLKSCGNSAEIVGILDVKAMKYTWEVIEASRNVLGDKIHKISCVCCTPDGSSRVIHPTWCDVCLDSESGCETIEIKIGDFVPSLKNGEIIVVCEIDKGIVPMDQVRKVVRALARKISEQTCHEAVHVESGHIIAVLHQDHKNSCLRIVWGSVGWQHLVGQPILPKNDFWTALELLETDGDSAHSKNLQRRELVDKVFDQDGVSLPMVLSCNGEKKCILSVQILPLTDSGIGLMACSVHAILNIDIDEEQRSDRAPDLSVDGDYLPSTHTRDSLFDTVQMGTLIGKGGYGSVYRAVLDGEVVALKVVDGVDPCTSISLASGPSSKVIGRQEVEVGQKLNHENIVKTIDYATRSIEGREQTWIVLEFCESGSLRQLIEDNYFQNSTEKITRVAQQIAIGMAYLHSQNVLHGDLSSNNVLFDRRYLAKISDFGLSRDFAGVTIITSALGTTCYMAPELLSNGKLNKKGDVYSYGVLLSEMLTGKRAFSGMRYVEVITSKLAENANSFLLTDIPSGSSKMLTQLVADCTKVDYASRPSFDEIVSRFHDDIMHE